MKQLYALAFILIGFAASGQTTRIALFEEFTGENCGPCAATNPALDALVQANSTKIIMLKHQVPIPSAGPIYNEWPTDANTRRAYYGLNSAPSGKLNGADFGPASQPTHPYYLDQTLINNAAAMSAPFGVTVTHTVSTDLDSIYINVSVQNMSGAAFNSSATGQLKLHVSVIEEEINFNTPPGTNGETDYYHINRKMFPSATGTTLADSWTAGQSFNFSFAEPLPMHIYNYNEIGVVAYVQDDGTKAVHQAASSASQPVSSTATSIAISDASTLPPSICSSSFTPAFEIQNSGGSTLSAADVRYRVNGGAWVTQSWSGSLGTGSSTTVTFPQINVPFLTNSIEAEVLVPGIRDVNKLDNTILPINIVVMGTLVKPAPYTANFENSSIGNVPSDIILDDKTGRIYVVNNTIATGVTWNLGAYEQSSKSLRVDFYTIPVGEVSNIYYPKVSTNGISNPKLYFSHAYQMYPGAVDDNLSVYLSKDCGVTWTKVFDRTGSDLATVAGTNSSRLYPQANDWTTNVIPIPNFANENEVIVRFEANSGYGNSLYLDNVSIGSVALGVEELELADINMFPNPASSDVEITIDNATSGIADIEVTDMNGRVIAQISADLQDGSNSIPLDVSGWAAGVYAVKVSENDNVRVLRLSVTH